MDNKFLHTGVVYGLIANSLVLGLVAYAFVLGSSFPDFYYLSIQEDEYLEWSTFWAFLLAAAVHVRIAVTDHRTIRVLRWYPYVVALFCLVVAMEEISWGQRIFGYRPPVYFLEYNFQQEFNFHNVVEADYRKLALMMVIVGYGVILPVAAQVKFLKTWLDRLGITAPTLLLLPAFTATFLVYFFYPWGHSGEWVELMLGLSFVLSAMRMDRVQGDEDPPLHQTYLGSSKMATIAFLTIMILGLGSAAGSRVQYNAHPGKVQTAKTELEAISQDFASGLVSSRCNRHKRLYTFVEKYDQTALFSGSYSALQSQGLPSERADFFLDPWNSPYWIRDYCDRQSSARVKFVYSFGPNRRRDSTRTEILGDDIGSYISAP